MISNASRRQVLVLTAAAAVAVAVAGASVRAATSAGHIRARDGTKLFVQERGQGSPVVFIHGWSLSGDVWREQFAVLPSAGARCIAYDRRGHGRSDRPQTGFEYETLADDLAAVLDDLDLRGATLVAHSMGGGEAVRYLSRHGTKRVARMVLIAPTTPLLLQGPDNPNGLPLAALDGLRAALKADYAEYIRANARGFFLPSTPQEIVDWGIRLSLQCDPNAAIACTHAYSETDFRGELANVATPTLLLHGEADALPMALTSRPTAALIKGSVLKTFPGGPHGVFVTHKEAVNAALAAFLQHS